MVEVPRTVLRYHEGKYVNKTLYLTIHICAVQFVHKRGTHTTRSAQITRQARFAKRLCAPEKDLSSDAAHVSSLVASPAFHHEHLFFLIHSSFYGTRTTPRTHPVHHAHLQAPSVDKLRHQESLWREDLQSGGNPRTTTPTEMVQRQKDAVFSLGIELSIKHPLFALLGATQ